MIKNLLHSFTAFLLLSLMMAGCQKKGTPVEEEDEQTIDAVFMALDENAPPLDCGEGGTPVPVFYTEEIANGFCRLDVPLVDSAAKSKRGIGAVIKNKAAFDKFFTCREIRPPIDFDNYFVLAGLYRHHSGAFFKNHEILLCGDTIVFKVNMTKGAQAASYSVFSMVSVEKKYSNMAIHFEMEFTD